MQNSDAPGSDFDVSQEGVKTINKAVHNSKRAIETVFRGGTLDFEQIKRIVGVEKRQTISVPNNRHRPCTVERRLSERCLTERPLIRTVVWAGLHPPSRACPARASALQFSRTCRDSFACYCTRSSIIRKYRFSEHPSPPISSDNRRSTVRGLWNEGGGVGISSVFVIS
ncbi:hypothetical protein EVAR_60878_1 [Eumeta japonica]|uniref:Uncharacterized protein n=1 Tax=Eumeta variegata TaxID=151549 RepID=A0A4C1YEY2_EUMVA|nr:hypothetical protein EVAR_60878_1 [Eumeta japonica]